MYAKVISGGRLLVGTPVRFLDNGFIVVQVNEVMTVTVPKEEVVFGIWEGSGVVPALFHLYCATFNMLK